ncbi:hypothetical protein [Streptomyces syringium]|uniref:hypothetical protein n=1 Tax=Streptomyces syringium TaxID=76729 RepID=UPI003455F7AF
MRDFGLNLTKEPAAVEFHARAKGTIVVDNPNAGDGYVDDRNAAKAMGTSGHTTDNRTLSH